MSRQKLLTLAALLIFSLLAAVLTACALERLRAAPFDPSLSALLPVTLTEKGDPAVEAALRARLSGGEAQTVTVLVTVRAPALSRRDRETLAVRAREAAAGVFLASGLIPAAGDTRRTADAFRPYAGRLMTDADRRFLKEALAAGETAPQRLLERAVRCLTGPAQPRLLGFQNDPFCFFDGWAAERQAAAGVIPVVTEAGAAPMTAADEPGESTAVLVMKAPEGLAEKGTGLLNQSVASAESAARSVLKDADASLSLTAAGIPLFTDAIASRAQTELTLIGTISSIGVVGFALLLFGSPAAALMMALTVAVGFWIGLSAALTAFGTLSLVTFVFGATLIGVTVDYSAHWFAGMAGRGEGGFEHQRRLLPSLTLAALSSAAAYGVLSLTPLPGLRQMSLLAAAGVAAAYLAVILLLPFASGFVRPPLTRLMFFLSEHLPRLPRLTPTSLRRPAVLAGLLSALVLTAAGLLQLHAGTGIRDLQGAPEELVRAQAEVGRRLALPSPAQCFVIEAPDLNAALLREKALRRALDERGLSGRIQTSGLGGWLPDRSTEAEGARLSAEAVKLISPALTDMLGAAPLPPSQKPFSAEALAGTPAGEAARHFILADGPRGSALLVMLAGLTPDDLPILRETADALPGVQFADMTGHMSDTLAAYRNIVLTLLLAGAGLLFVMLLRPFGRDAWRAVVPALTGIAAAGAVSGWLGLPFTLFTALAMVLLLGIGADCGIFLAASPADGRAWAAVLFAGITTMLSFGLLAFSATPALHAFGLTVLTGEAAVWAAAAALRPGRSALARSRRGEFPEDHSAGR